MTKTALLTLALAFASASGAAEDPDAIPSTEEARKWHRHFTSVPHPPTSKANDHMAEYIADQWRQQGIEDVPIRRCDVLSSNPREVKVERPDSHIQRGGIAYDYIVPGTRWRCRIATCSRPSRSSAGPWLRRNGRGSRRRTRRPSLRR